MSEGRLVGLNPWLPWPLTRWPWWTEPVRAERLAALRIGVAAVLLLDIFTTYLPLAGVFFGRQSLGDPEIFAGSGQGFSRWSALSRAESPLLLQSALVLWAVAAAFLLAGTLPRASAVIAWLLSVSFIGINYYLHNSGDSVRTILLFYLMLSPCGAAWSLQKATERAPNQGRGPVYVPAWPLRLLFIQLVLIYFLNGVFKFAGPDWRQGRMMYTVLTNLAWTRISYAQVPLPLPVIQLLTWGTLAFELSFPLLVFAPRTRTLALWVGIAFHLGTEVFLQLGPFPVYMMCLYLPLVPWERYSDAFRRRLNAKSMRSSPPAIAQAVLQS